MDIIYKYIKSDIEVSCSFCHFSEEDVIYLFKQSTHTESSENCISIFNPCVLNKHATLTIV